MANNGHPLRIWSFDAGGPGILSGQFIVEEIMRRLGNDTKPNSEDPPLPCDHADLMVGTHLGAVAALLLGRLRLSPEKVMTALGMIGEEVFAPQGPNKMISDRPVISDAPEHMNSLPSSDSSMNASPKSETAPSSPLQRAISYGSSFVRLFSSSIPTPTASLDTPPVPPGIFSTEKLRKVVTKILKMHGCDEKTKLIGELPEGQCNVAVVCAYASNANTAVLLRTYESKSSQPDYTILEAVLATMSTPNWFNPVPIGGGRDAPKFIGGCMRTYNPIQEALKEARALYKQYPVCSIISIGSGRHAAHRLKQCTKEGLKDTLDHMILDCNNTADAVGRDFARHTQHQEVYQRLSVDEEMTQIPITDWNDERFSDIKTQTDTYLEKPGINRAIDMAVQNLKGRTGYVFPTIGDLTSSLMSQSTQMGQIAPPGYSKDWQDYASVEE